MLTQPDSVRTFLTWCFTGLPMIGYGICAMIMLFYNVESKMPRISRELALRHSK